MLKKNLMKILKKIKNSKGFTLIELLAVIVILGILMIVAIPQITKYIENSRKDTYVDTAKSYINAARYMLLNDDWAGATNCTLPSDGATAYIDLGAINLESGGKKSSYNKDINGGYVQIVNTGGVYNYSICIVDAGGNGTHKGSDDATILESDLTRNSIKKGGCSCAKPTNRCTTKPNGSFGGGY